MKRLLTLLVAAFLLLGCEGPMGPMGPMGAKGDKGDKGIIVGVQWDSGSYSLFTPEALEVVK